MCHIPPREQLRHRQLCFGRAAPLVCIQQGWQCRACMPATWRDALASDFCDAPKVIHAVMDVHRGCCVHQEFGISCSSCNSHQVLALLPEVSSVRPHVTTPSASCPFVDFVGALSADVPFENRSFPSHSELSTIFLVQGLQRLDSRHNPQSVSAGSTGRACLYFRQLLPHLRPA